MTTPPPFSAEVKNTRRRASIPSHALLACTEVTLIFSYNVETEFYVHLISSAAVPSCKATEQILIFNSIQCGV